MLSDTRLQQCQALRIAARISDAMPQNAERGGADLNGDNLRIYRVICGSVITVGLTLGLGLELGLRLGLQIVYKLLEQVTKYGSIT